MLLDCFGRTWGPRLLGRVDASKVITGFLFLFCFPWPFCFIAFNFWTVSNFAFVGKQSFIVVIGNRMQQRLVSEFYKVFNQVSTEEIPDGLKLPDSFSQLVSEMKDNRHDAKTFAFILKAMVCEVYNFFQFSLYGKDKKVNRGPSLFILLCPAKPHKVKSVME